jgi:hypothetical protein
MKGEGMRPSSQVHFAWRESAVLRRFHTGVSLHSHTMHSQESLDFIPAIARKAPVLREVVDFEERRYEKRHGQRPRYDTAYWTPAPSEREAFQLERKQIVDNLGLAPLVSLSDHDSIEAAMHLHMVEKPESVPVSVEWTVPFGPSFFHLGVHNLPRGEARPWMDALAEYTKTPDAKELQRLLAALHERPEILVVFNHPFWDEKGIGLQAHGHLVATFLDDYGAWIHALELNGMRTWTENKRVMELAKSTGHCAISGGDRHGLEPNAILNLTNALSFEEFVDEVRKDRMSDLLVMPQYREPLAFRYAECIWETIRDYPQNPGRVRWADRFYQRTGPNTAAPFATLWGCNDGPGAIGVFIRILGLLGSRRLRSTLRLAMRATGEVLP